MTEYGAPTGTIPITAMPARARGALPWVILVVAAITYAVAILGRASLAGVGTEAATRFGIDSTTLAMFATLQVAVYGGMQIPVGLLLDRFGARIVLTAGMLVMAGGSVWLAFTTDPGQAIAARAITGGGDALVFPSVLRLLAFWFPPKRVPLLQQIIAQVGQLGQIASVLVLAVVVDEVSWTFGFALLAALMLAFALGSGLVVREPRLPEQSARPQRSQGRLVVESLAEPGTRLGFWVHFTTQFAATTVALLWGMPYLTHAEGLTHAAAAGMFTLFVAAGAAWAPLLGMLSAAQPRRRPLIAASSVFLQIVTTAAVLLSPGAAPMWLLVVWMVVLAGGGATSMIAFDITRRFNPIYRLSTATGVVNMGGFMASLVAIAAVGILLDLQGADPVDYTRGELRVAFCALFVIWAVGLVGMAVESWRVRRRERAGGAGA